MRRAFNTLGYVICGDNDEHVVVTCHIPSFIHSFIVHDEIEVDGEGGRLHYYFSSFLPLRCEGIQSFRRQLS